MNPDIALRPANQSDATVLQRWDQEPHVIVATTDNPEAVKAFEDADWLTEIDAQDAYSQYFIAELRGRPIGAMQIIDPHREATHYWGEIEPNLRAIDIWIGEPDCLGCGYGETMMRLAFQRCFEDPTIEAIVIDPLASNVRAHKFYRRLGFQSLGERVFGEDLCLVHRLERSEWCRRFPYDSAG